MEEHDEQESALMSQPRVPLGRRAHQMSIGALEAALLQRFPAHDAESWDRMGVIVGERTQPVRGVAVALDATVDAIEQAREAGANVLLTHHPVFLSPAPATFAPARSEALNPGAGVWAAIEGGVALMNLHTALDVSQEATTMLPGMLNLAFCGIVDPLEGDRTKGYGQLCTFSDADRGSTLAQLAARCTAVFGRPPRVWGGFDSTPERIVTCTGSAGNLAKLCLAKRADCLICGEIKYHDALAASCAGLSIIELGHDVSELPLVALLAIAAEEAGIPSEALTVIDQGQNWTYPEATRR